jgi:erythromycin esterase-like protein
MKTLCWALLLGLWTGLSGCANRDEPAMPAALTIPQEGVYPLSGAQDLDVLLGQVGNARYVLLGEASHGTAEFYEWRAAITRRLIQEKGFTLMAVEGDWPDLYEVNRYVRGAGNGASARAVLGEFRRWPTWMWANEPVAELAEWMRTYNAAQPAARRVGLYGLDVYSVRASLQRLSTDFPEANAATRAALADALDCLDQYGPDEEAYAQATLTGATCAGAVSSVLTAVQAQVAALPAGHEGGLNALQNATVAVNGERYYRLSVRSSTEPWNLRDRHMTATINRLVSFYGPTAKIVVWAHNTHVGDARYTNMADQGLVNVGQLVREEHGGEGVLLVGFSTYQGSVVAAPAWGGPATTMTVPPARAGTWEADLHQHSPENKLLLLGSWRSNELLSVRHGHRAIGVVYDPGGESGNYVPTDLPHRYDALLFIDQTRALLPLPVGTGGKAARGAAPGQAALDNY